MVYAVTDQDRLFVERAVMAGTNINVIADCLNITDDTLRKYYKYEIVTGRERLKGDAVRVLMDSLTDGSLDAAKYVLSRVAGWRETVNTEGQIAVSVKRDLSNVSDAAIAEIALALNAQPDAE